MKIENRKAQFNADIQDRFEAGIILTGAEVKAVRAGKVDLSASFAKISGQEMYLYNVRIFPYEYARPDGYDEVRTRKLLLHKRQIVGLKGKMDGANLTLTPLSMYTTRGLVKVELGLGKPKKLFQKKQSIKKRDLDRELASLSKYH